MEINNHGVFSLSILLLADPSRLKQHEAWTVGQTVVFMSLLSVAELALATGRLIEPVKTFITTFIKVYFNDYLRRKGIHVKNTQITFYFMSLEARKWRYC